MQDTPSFFISVPSNHIKETGEGLIKSCYCVKSFYLFRIKNLYEQYCNKLTVGK